MPVEPPNNDTRHARVTALIADVRSSQLDAKSHQEQFKNVSELAYGAIQQYLKSKGHETTDDLVKNTIRALPPEKQQEILDHMKELTPPKGLAFLFQPSEIAKFIFPIPIVSGITKVSKPFYVQAKASWISYRSNALLSTTRAGQALTAEGKALAELSAAERAEFLADLDSEQILLQGDEFVAAAETELEEVVASIEKAVEAVENIEAAEAEALAAAAKISVWTGVRISVFFVVGVVAIAGLIFYDKYEEHKIGEERKETIKKVATARLYSRMSERMELTHTDQLSTINMLAQAFADDDKAAKDFVLQNFLKTIDKSLVKISEQTTYDLLQEQDKEANADTREDPSLEDMRKGREEEKKKGLQDRKVKTSMIKQLPGRT